MRLDHQVQGPRRPTPLLFQVEVSRMLSISTRQVPPEDDGGRPGRRNRGRSRAAAGGRRPVVGQVGDRDESVTFLHFRDDQVGDRAAIEAVRAVLGDSSRSRRPIRAERIGRPPRHGWPSLAEVRWKAAKWEESDR